MKVSYRSLCFLVVLLLGINSEGKAQTQVGIKGGLNLSNLYIDEASDEKLRTGFHVGGYVNAPIVGDILSIQPEVLFSTKGSKNDFNMDLGPLGQIDQETTFNLNYIDVPIMFVINLADVAEVHVGPYVGYLLGASISTEGDILDGNEELDKDDFQTWDYGAALGLAIELGAAQVGARYNLGLQEIAENENSEMFLGDSKNNYIQVYLAFRFGEE